MKRCSVQSWKYFPCTLTKVRTTLCTTKFSFTVSEFVSDTLLEALVTVPSCAMHTKGNTSKVMSRFFILPFEEPSSSSTHIQPSADHFSSATTRKEYSCVLASAWPSQTSWASRWTLRLRTWITKASGNGLQEHNKGSWRQPAYPLLV